MSSTSSRELAAIRAFSAAAGALPWGFGQYRLASPYAARKRWPEGFTAEQRMSSGANLCLDLSDRTQLIAFMLRDYGPSLTQYINERLPYRATLFDVGGHVGMISFTMATLRPDVTIHAFEPNPANAAGWRRNHALNPSDRVGLTEKGVSDRDGELRFSVPTDSISGMALEGGEQTVSAVTLDTYCAENDVPHIDVLKIDVQGHEPAVLRGAQGMLGEGRVDTVICEICPFLLDMGGEDPGAIIEPLKTHGFRVAHLPEAGLRRRMPGSGIQEDLAFERV